MPNDERPRRVTSTRSCTPPAVTSSTGPRRAGSASEPEDIAATLMELMGGSSSDTADSGDDERSPDQMRKRTREETTAPKVECEIRTEQPLTKARRTDQGAEPARYPPPFRADNGAVMHSAPGFFYDQQQQQQQRAGHLAYVGGPTQMPYWRMLAPGQMVRPLTHPPPSLLDIRSPRRACSSHAAWIRVPTAVLRAGGRSWTHGLGTLGLRVRQPRAEGSRDGSANVSTAHGSGGGEYGGGSRGGRCRPAVQPVGPAVRRDVRTDIHGLGQRRTHDCGAQGSPRSIDLPTVPRR